VGEQTGIQWCHHTFNPWRGCARVSPGCEHCYAETLSKRNPKVLGVWGVQGTRVVASDAMWREPLKWDAAARRLRERHRVFCASLADVAEDRPDLVEPRARLVRTIKATSSLDWLLLTKRPENLTRLFPEDILRRCWIGTTAEDQQRADERITLLLQTPAAVRFISAEPLLEKVDLKCYLDGHEEHGTPFSDPPARTVGGCIGWTPPLSWVIVGGESGPGSRPFDLAWARSIVSQCTAAGVPVFVKQLGLYAVEGLRDDMVGFHPTDRI
jgi:protein gp37